MKEASRIMYKIGKVFNIISIPLAGIFLVIGGFLLFITLPFLAYGVYDLKNAEIEGTKVLDYLALGFVFSFIGIIILAIGIVSLIICIKKNRLIENGDNGISPRVFLIVFGALSDNIFYILSGIFSLIARTQESNQKFEVVEEPKQGSTSDAEIKENIEKYENNDQQ